MFFGDELSDIGCWIAAFFTALGAAVTVGALIFTSFTVVRRLIG